MIDKVGEALAAASWKNLTPAAKEKLGHCMIANFSVAVAGLPYTRLPAPAAAPQGHFLFSGRRTAAARDAAFWNAAVMHARRRYRVVYVMGIPNALVFAALVMLMKSALFRARSTSPGS